MRDDASSKPALPWCESFGIGIDALDADHRAMVSLINEICAHWLAGQRAPAIDGLESLCTLAAEHFEREEAVLRVLSGYNSLPAHAGEHRNRLKQLTVLRQRFNDTADAATGTALCNQLIDWFVRQSVGHDAEVRALLDDRGARFPGAARGPHPET